MQDFYEVLLYVWSEACRHIELNESVPNITRLLQKDLNLIQILIKHVDLRTGQVKTVATGFPQLAIENHLKITCSASQLKMLRNWLKKGRAELETDPPVANLISFSEPVGSIFCGPIHRGDVAGMVFFIAPPNCSFDSRSKMLMKVLVEPLAVALENHQRIEELKQLRKAAEADKKILLYRLGREKMADTIIGEHTGLKGVFERIEPVTRSDLPILILGETGTGKEVIGRLIHNRSDRAVKSFIRVNCGAIPPELIDSQLFGHVKGAFTGAVSNKTGWFEQADGGTLFLDEIGELPPAAQVRLLRVLQDGWFERVGDNKGTHVNVRIIAATNQDLAHMVAQGRFREDLWYRIATFPIILPPLRQRIEDIPELAEHFVHRAARRFRLYPVMPDEPALEMLQSYDWPGNIREFGAVIDRASILGNGKTLEIAKSLGWDGTASDKALSVQNSDNQMDLEKSNSALDDVVRQHIEKVLRQTHGRIDGSNGAAVLLGINPHTLRGRMRKLGIQWKNFRPIEK